MIFRLPGIKRKERTENELLSEFHRTGDLEVLGELYARYMHLVYGVCVKYLKDRDNSMDAVMQIFEKLVTEVPKREIDNFGSWLHVVAKNHCLMQLRSARSNKEMLTGWETDPGIFMENETYPHPIDDEGRDIDKELEDCIEKLKEDQRECIRMFYYGNKCYEEIAETLAIDEKKVKSYLQNGKRNLKICLESKNERE